MRGIVPDEEPAHTQRPGVLAVIVMMHCEADIGRIVTRGDSGLERENRKFRAHLTLARLRESVLPEELVQKLGEVPAMALSAL